ncbi:MAG TPA: ABC transporter permease [Candidatus Pacearchaeota archaeon]|nr:ABC transporter permease [Candidatus Pacearchaeota archaeon]
MNILEAIKVSLQMLLRNKMQSFLTMLGIVIGVMAVVIVMSIGASAQEFILSEVKTIGTDLIGVLPGKSDKNAPPSGVMGIVNTSLKYEDGEDILKKNYQNIDSLAMYVQGNSNIIFEDNSTNASFTGSTESYLVVEKAKIASGRFFTKEEEKNFSRVAVLGSNLAKELFGDQDPVNKRVKIKKLNFKVIGVFEEKGSSFVQDQDKSVIIPIKTAQKLLLGIDYISLMRIKLSNEAFISSTIEEIESSLRESHNINDPKDDDFTISSAAEALNSLRAITDALKFFLIAVSAISLIVGGFGIMNIMLATVEERVGEIGLRKALGAKNHQITLQFLIETVVITFLSGIIGIILGTVVSFIAYKVIIALGIKWFFMMPIPSIIVAALVSISIGLIFGIVPAQKASKLNPIEALHYE